MTTNQGSGGGIPQEFQDIFRQVLSATRVGNTPITRETCRVYYETLGDFPLDVLRESAQNLRRTSTFFPSTAEWFQAASVLILRTRPAPSDCRKCAGRGLIAVKYHSGEPYDVAICDCADGKFFERAGEGLIRHTLSLTNDHRVAFLEDFD